MKKAVLIIILILIADQILKIWIKTNFYLGESHAVLGRWFFLHFTENEGMAFGMSLGGSRGKLLLSIFRIIAIVAIAWWLYSMTRKKTNLLLVISLSLILAGAIGNVIDSAFYGLIFTESNPMQMATLFPVKGYASFLHGRVVDMLYFPLIETRFPQWVPFYGGEDFIFFRPVFNIADSSITTGVLMMIVFQRKIFRK